MKMVELVAGGIVGLGVNNLAMTALASTVSGNPLLTVGASVAVALAFGAAVNMIPKIGKEMAPAVTFGGLMGSAQIAINQWIPSVGSTIGLSGLRDFVPGKFPVPQTPVVLSAGGPMGGGPNGAYPMAYGIAA